jgi:hypothetical protein
MERDEEWRAVETGCRGGQGSPRAVVPSGRQAGTSFAGLEKYHILVCKQFEITFKPSEPI